MFIPLSINSRDDEKDLLNIGIIGDTAYVFYKLSELQDKKCNIFICDTGIKRPLREYPHKDSAKKDKANTYYDFFDGKVGMGITERMDFVFSNDVTINKHYLQNVEKVQISAWDTVQDLNDKGFMLEDNNKHEQSQRLIELGIPELDIFEAYDMKNHVHRYIELTGDLNRVFDGLM